MFSSIAKIAFLVTAGAAISAPLPDDEVTLLQIQQSVASAASPQLEDAAVVNAAAAEAISNAEKALARNVAMDASSGQEAAAIKSAKEGLERALHRRNQQLAEEAKKAEITKAARVAAEMEEEVLAAKRGAGKRAPEREDDYDDEDEDLDGEDDEPLSPHEEKMMAQMMKEEQMKKGNQKKDAPRNQKQRQQKRGSNRQGRKGKQRMPQRMPQKMPQKMPQEMPQRNQGKNAGTTAPAQKAAPQKAAPQKPVVKPVVVPVKLTMDSIIETVTTALEGKPSEAPWKINPWESHHYIQHGVDTVVDDEVAHAVGLLKQTRELQTAKMLKELGLAQQ